MNFELLLLPLLLLLLPQLPTSIPLLMLKLLTTMAYACVRHMLLKPNGIPFLLSVILTVNDMLAFTVFLLWFTWLIFVTLLTVRRYPALNFKLPALYIRSQLPFPEVELFVQNTVKRYNSCLSPEFYLCSVQ